MPGRTSGDIRDELVWLGGAWLNPVWRLLSPMLIGGKISVSDGFACTFICLEKWDGLSGRFLVVTFLVESFISGRKK